MKEFGQFMSSDFRERKAESIEDVDPLRSILADRVEEPSDGVAGAQISEGSEPRLDVNKAFEAPTAPGRVA